MKRPAFLLVLLVVVAFSFGLKLQPRFVRADAGPGDNVFKMLFGEGRRMFANHFAVKADVYLHSGFYPSIFDQSAAVKEAGVTAPDAPSPESDHADEHAHAVVTQPDGHKCDTSFMGAPRDWIEAFGRAFLVTEHAHLEGGKEREILPWLRLSAQLDPQRIETYTVAAYWLVERMNKPKEAEAFLREGLRENPQSYEILFDLGKIYDAHINQPARARNVWKLALQRWNETEPDKEKPDTLAYERVLVYLGELERRQGDFLQAVLYFDEAGKFSPRPDALAKRIRDVWLQLALPPPTVDVLPH